MGKSERNGVDPQTLIDRYGADTARLYVMFAGTPEDSAVWSDTGVEGASRFLKRLWTFAQAQLATVRGAPAAFDYRDADDAVRKARRELHMTLKQANDDYERIHYNTVVSAGMIMLNTLEALPAGARGADALMREGLSLLLRVLYPGHAAHDVGAVERPRLRSRVGRPHRRAVAGGRRRRARAGRDRARAAGQRQAARQDRRAGEGRRTKRSRRPRARAPKSRSTPTARR